MFLCDLQVDVHDQQEAVYELSESLENICFDIQNITTDEIRSGNTIIEDYIKEAKSIRILLGQEIKVLEKSIKLFTEFL